MSQDLIKGADGKFYIETPEGEFVEAPKQASSPGALVEMRDERVHQKQHGNDSMSSRFFDEKYGPKTSDKRRLKQAAAIEKTVQALTERVEPGPHSGVQVITDEKYLDLHETYRRAQAAGKERECEFQPLSTYQHKIQRARPILKGEVGMLGAMILRLDVGYGQGAIINVPVDLKGGEDDEPEERSETENGDSKAG